MHHDSRVDVNQQLDHLVDRLAQEFSGQVSKPTVEHAVRRVRNDFGSPPITQFLPVLIEREVRATLSGPGDGRPGRAGQH